MAPLETRQGTAATLRGRCARPHEPLAPIGIVVIGRNEGERLRACLASLRPAVAAGYPVVYVDSGSVDGSVALAREAGAAVVELGPCPGYSMARGRNAGLRFLADHWPQLLYVQFVDGDCELVGGWLERAHAALEHQPDVVAISGRLLECSAEHSIYGRLLGLEWAESAAETPGFGGNVFGRIQALLAAGGFDPTLVAGEEAELSLRLRRQGWRIARLEAMMTRHHGAILSFWQWWRRAIRYGWSVAAAVDRHGVSFGLRNLLSGWFWGLGLPLAGMGLAGLVPAAAPLVPFAYLGFVVRIYRHGRRLGFEATDAWLYAAFCALSKMPQAVGQCRYLFERMRGAAPRLVEYEKR